MQYSEEQLRSIGDRKRKRREFSKLGDLTSSFLDNEVSARYGRYSKVVEVWNEMLPAELARHCRLDGIERGRLKVVVDKPAYRYELETCKGEIVKRLQQDCPSVKIESIKASIG